MFGFKKINGFIDFFNQLYKSLTKVMFGVGKGKKKFIFKCHWKKKIQGKDKRENVKKIFFHVFFR